MTLARNILCAVGVLTGALAVSCAGPKIAGAPAPATKPNFAPLRADIQHLTTQAQDTTRRTAAVVDAFNTHAADTQPTALFVSQNLPLAVAADESAKRTYADAGPLDGDRFTVETQSNLVYATQNAAIAVAVQDQKAATEYKADYTKEKNSIFGGKLGHWLEDALWIGGIIGVLFLVSQVLLSSFPGTGWINFLAIPIHIVGNIVRVGWAALSSAVSWAWNELALWHVPWGQSALPATPAPPPATTAAPAPATKDTLPPMPPPESSGPTAAAFGFRPMIQAPILIATSGLAIILSLAN